MDHHIYQEEILYPLDLDGGVRQEQLPYLLEALRTATADRAGDLDEEAR